MLELHKIIRVPMQLSVQFALFLFMSEVGRENSSDL